jgi:hypothetical protein
VAVILGDCNHRPVTWKNGGGSDGAFYVIELMTRTRQASSHLDQSARAGAGTLLLRPLIEGASA